MIDAVECRRQIRVKSPEPFRVPSLDYLVNRLDRVVAATAGPEAVGLRLEPCLPFGLQCVFHPCLQHAISYHRNLERAPFSIRFRDEYPLDGTSMPRLGMALHPICQRRLSVGGRNDLPVDTRRLAASIVLRDPPHADQRVSAGPEHQFLQTADLLQVPRLARREDPLPQALYVPLHGTPRNSVPVHRSARRSVHVGGNRLGVQLALRFQRSYQVCLTGSPGPRQLPCGPGIASRIRPVMREIAGGQRLAFPVSCCLSAAGVRFLDHPVPLGISAFLAVGLPGSASCCPGPQPGFPCSARMRYDRGGCSLCPGGDGVLPARRACPDRHLPLSSGQPLHPARHFPPARIRSHETSARVQCHSPVRSSSRP